MTSPSFEFKYATDSNLSDEAQKLMENVRDEAARIKAQMIADKGEQDRKDEDAEQLYGGISAACRKIAKPKGKAGRFSDIHMAEFKKMDSIANHASSFRAQPGFARPTTQSLKRSGSRAGLDDPERPRTAGKGTPGKPVPPFIRPASASPFKSTTTTTTTHDSDGLENLSSAKRMRQSEFGDVSSGKPSSFVTQDSSKPSGLPRAKSTMPASVFSPTKASLARSASTKIPLLSPEKKSFLPRSNSVRSLKSAFEAVRSETDSASPTPKAVSNGPASKLARSQSMKSMRPLPPLPAVDAKIPRPDDTVTGSSSINAIPAAIPKTGGLTSRLPTLAGLKSILRPSRVPAAKKTSILAVDQAGGTPKRSNATVPGSGSTKKVDFTPSTKSRYAVKLAAATPSPSKLSHAGAISTPTASFDVYDPAAYIIDDDDKDEAEDWEDAESEIDYPTLPSLTSGSEVPPAPSVNTFSEKAKLHNRRESKEFKSIFTTLEHPSRSKPAATLTDVNTKVNKTNPTTHANIVTRSPSNTNLAKPSPSTIRRVRTSGVTELVQPFEDTIKTVPHGLPGKKRRRETEKADGLHDAGEDAKENRQPSVMPQVPGGWDAADNVAVDEKGEDEGEKRGGKKPRVGESEPGVEIKVKVKKPNAAREAAAKNAKERKGKSKGMLSLSRLNMLARPKERK